jgi:hypothetical protein
MLTKDEGAKAAEICKSLATGKDANMDEVCGVVSKLQGEIAQFQSPGRQWVLWVPCLRQCAGF